MKTLLQLLFKFIKRNSPGENKPLLNPGTRQKHGVVLLKVTVVVPVVEGMEVLVAAEDTIEKK